MEGFFTPLVRARTYRRLAYMLLGLFFGIFYFVFLVTAVSVGVGLVVIWVGVLILVAAVAAWRAIGHFERGFANAMLGGKIEPPRPLEVETADGRSTLWARIKATLADSYTYRSFFWLLVRFPFGIAGFVIGVTGLALSVGFLFAPIALALPGDVFTEIDRLPEVVQSLEWLVVLLPLVGVVVAAITAHVINGFAEVHLMIARSLLGPGARREIQVAQRRATAAEERTKLAHELHDSVGHTLTRMVVQAGAGSHVYEKDPDFARKALENIESSGRDALAELDRLLGILREDDAADRKPQPGMEQIPDLIDDLREAGLEVTLAVEGSVTDMPIEVSRAGFRIVQEALTNVMKHAGRVPVSVAIHRGAGSVEIEVLNDPSEVPDADTGFENGDGGGRGLVGLEERASILGGSVEVGPRPGGGFRVWAKLPTGDVE